MNGTKPRTDHLIRLAVLALLAGGCLLVLLPFLSALMWAIVLCFASWPVYAKLLRFLKGRRTLAALVMTTVTTLALLAPFAIIALSLSDDAQRAADAVWRVLGGGEPEPPAWVGRIPLVGERAQGYWRALAQRDPERLAELQKLFDTGKVWLLQASLKLGRGVVELALSLMILFFLYRHGIAAAVQLQRASERIGGERARSLLEIAGNTTRGVVYGILGTAVAQSVVAGIGFVIAGIPQAGFWALATFFLSVVPVGPPLVWVPITIWLFSQGSIGWGIFMAIWGIMISSVDNVIKPLIISRGSSLPFLLIFFGVLGGALAFGFIGVFLGPVLMAVGFRLLTEWTASQVNGSALSETPAPPETPVAPTK